ncbi:MAG: kelch repeat-containing protein [Kiritimatiellia bacterium]
MTSRKKVLFLLVGLNIGLVLWGLAQDVVMPGKLTTAPPNTWVMLDVGGYGARNSVGLVYLPREGTLLLVGGAMGAGGPYSEMTFNLKEGRWENRFPRGKEGVWGELVGPSKAPALAHGTSFGVTDGVLRPNLEFGYNHRMELWGNAAYDAARDKVVVVFHRLGQTYEYDPATRTWQLIESASDVPYTFWDDIVFSAMCYDPVNKEVLAGQGRWALRNGRWVQLEFGSSLINGLRTRAEALALDLRKLIGACRARFYYTESVQMSAIRLDEVAADVCKQIKTFSRDLFDSLSKTKNYYERTQLRWAENDAEKAISLLAEAEPLIEDRPTAKAIAVLEDAWQAMDNVVDDLAVVPPKRAYFRPAVDEKRGLILIFGGHRLDRIVADTWLYDCKTRTWEQARPPLSPPPRYGHGLVWLPTSELFLLVDAAGYAETWAYGFDANRWFLIQEGNGKRESLTSHASTWGWQPEMSAAMPGDIVITLSNRAESKVPRYSTWAARFDLSESNVDLDGTTERGVDVGTVSFTGGRTADPCWYDERAGEIDPADQQQWIENLPSNTWVMRDKESQRNNPEANRAWGTTAYDPDHDQLLQWGGGHVAYVGNAVLHYSLKANRFYIGHRPEEGLMYAHGQGGMKISTSYRNRAFMTGHAYHSYAYDTVSGKLVVCGQTLAENTVKASLYFCYDPAAGEWFPNPIRAPFPAHYGFDRLCTTPTGVVAWASGKLWKVNWSELKWEELPLEGVKLPGVSHEMHGMVYDSVRGRLLLFSQAAKGDVVAYDFRSGRAESLSPAGKGVKVFGDVRCRELVYMPEWNAVLIASRIPDREGKMRWPLYDCAANAWKAVLLTGNDPTGKDYNVSLGLVYDTGRKIVWAADAYARIWALKPDLKAADVQPVEDAAATVQPEDP